MNYISCNMQAFIENTKAKQILCFGAGSYFIVMCCEMSECYPDMNLAGVLDNDAAKCGVTISAASFTTRATLPKAALSRFNMSNTVIVITTAQLMPVIDQLNSIGELSNTDVYSYFELRKNSAIPMRALKKNSAEPLIPKTINYCWFGGDEIPERLQKCMDTWKEFCPDYNIIRWDEHNYDISKNAFMKNAYDMKKWGFIPDFARLDIINNEGGLYFDTDVELLGSPDILRYNKGFIGTEIVGGVNAGSGLGAIRNHSALKGIIKKYNAMPGFYSETCMGRDTEYFFDEGYRVNGQMQIINDMTILPYNVLTHNAFETGESFRDRISLSLHHFDGAWR